MNTSQSSINQELSNDQLHFQNSLRKSTTTRTSLLLGSSSRRLTQEDDVLFQQMRRHVQRLTEWSSIRCKQNIELFFTDAKHPLRKHVTFQFFVPESKSHIGSQILNHPNFWTLLGIYFGIVVKQENQYSAKLKNDIQKKMARHLDEEQQLLVEKQIQEFLSENRASIKKDGVGTPEFDKLAQNLGGASFQDENENCKPKQLHFDQDNNACRINTSSFSEVDAMHQNPTKKVESCDEFSLQRQFSEEMNSQQAKQKMDQFNDLIISEHPRDGESISSEPLSKAKPGLGKESASSDQVDSSIKEQPRPIPRTENDELFSLKNSGRKFLRQEPSLNLGEIQEFLRKSAAKESQGTHSPRDKLSQGKTLENPEHAIKAGQPQPMWQFNYPQMDSLNRINLKENSSSYEVFDGKLTPEILISEQNEPKNTSPSRSEKLPDLFPTFFSGKAPSPNGVIAARLESKVCEEPKPFDDQTADVLELNTQSEDLRAQHCQELSDQINQSMPAVRRKRESMRLLSKMDPQDLQNCGSGMRLKVLKAPNQIMEQYGKEKIIVPVRSSRRFSKNNHGQEESLQDCLFVDNAIQEQYEPLDMHEMELLNQSQQMGLPHAQLSRITHVYRKSKQQQSQNTAKIKVRLMEENVCDNNYHAIARVVDEGDQFDSMALIEIRKCRDSSKFQQDLAYYITKIKFFKPDQKPLVLFLENYTLED